MLIRMVVLILLVSAQLFSMEDSLEKDEQLFDSLQIISKDEDPRVILEEEGGLTLKEAYDFLYERATYRLWRLKDVLFISSMTSFISVIFLGLPDYITAGFYCSGQTDKYNCLDACGKEYECRSRCWQTNFPGYDDPICQATLTLSLVSILPLIAVACSKPIAKLQNWCANSLNERAKNYLIQFLYRGRSPDQKLNDEDMLLIGSVMLAEQSNLLNKLSPSQALTLAPLDPKKFSTIVDQLADDPKVSANKLLRLLEMESSKLALLLKDPEMITYLKRYPILWQSLMRIIYQNKLINTKLIEAFHFSLKEISGLTREKKEEWDIIIADILAGKSIREFIGGQFKLEKIIVMGEKKLADDEVMLTTKKNEHYRVKKKLLIEKSNYFRAALEGPWAKSEEFSAFDAGLLEVLILVLDDELVITPQNLRIVLKAASFFQMESVSQSCDNFIFGLDIYSDALKPLFAHKKKELDNKDNSFRVRWKFCAKNHLLKNQHKLATEMLVDLQVLQSGESYSLLDVELMLKSDISSAMSSFNAQAFSERLKDPKFLSWLWPRVSTIPFLKACIVDFCADDQNLRIVDSAFAIVPEELRKKNDES